MKTKDLVIIGALGIGAFLLYKLFSSTSVSDGGWGGYAWTPTTPTPTTPIEPVIPSPPIVQRGAVIQQLPVVEIQKNSMENKVITAANVRSGQITVIPQTQLGSAFTKAPYKPTPTPPPLNIKTILGFPVVPKLVQPVPTKPTPTPPTVYKETSPKYHMGR